MILKRRAIIVTIISVLLISILVLATTIYVHRQSASSLDWVNNTDSRPTIGTYNPNQPEILSALAISQKDKVNLNHIKIIKVIAIHPGEWSVSYKIQNKAGVWTPTIGNYGALVIRPFTGSIYAVNDTHSANSNNSIKRTVSNVVLAKSKISGHSGQQLELVDVKGMYINNTTVGPFQGNNWTGQFQLRVVNSEGKVLSKLSLPDNKFTQLLFMRKFQFHFADYTDDGNPDFTLGQYASSNGSWYQIYEVKSDGIVQLPIYLFASDGGYSPLFQQVKPNGFKIKYYDNANAEWYQATYVWKKGKFEQSSLDAVSSK